MSRTDRTESFRWTPAVAIAAMAWLALFPITSVDAYYHLATGRWMLDHQEIPDRGIFSATFGDRPWHDNEWGFQVLVASIGVAEVSADGVLELTRGGTVALILLRALALAATLALLSAQMARAGVPALTRATAVVLAAFLTFNNLFWAIRPQILTYLAVAATTYLLGRDRDGCRWAGWAILGIIALWANVHGAFIIGIVLLGAETIGAAIDRSPRFQRLALWTALAPLAACLNPHGYLQVLHPFVYLLRPEIHAGNAEWTRPDFLHLPLFVLTAVLLVIAMARAGRPRMDDVVRAVAVVGLLTTAIRHLPIAALVLAPMLAVYGLAAVRRRGRSSPGPAVAAVATICIVVLSGAKFVGPVPEFTERTVRPMPEQAVRWIAGSGVEGAGFNAYRFGGFLMFRLYPSERVFMDGRNDLYEEFRDGVYNPIRTTEPGWEGMWRDAVRDHEVGWVLLDRGDPLVDALGRVGAGWIGPFETDGEGAATIALLVRDTPDNRARVRERTP